MSTTNNFLKALEELKQDLICPLCSELFENPLTFGACFHTICERHYKPSMECCPECRADIRNCTPFADPTFHKTIEATKQLQEIFKTHKMAETSLVVQCNTNKENPAKTACQAITDRQDCTEILKESSVLGKGRKVGIMTRSNSRESLKRKRNMTDSLVKLNGSFEKKNTKGETPLHIACRLGKTEKVVQYLQEGANVNTKDNAHWTPLHEAVQNGRLDLVTLLLEHNALVNVPGQSYETPLHEAVRYGHTRIAEELIKNGADINAHNSKGETPMRLASPDMRSAMEAARDNLIHTQTGNINDISIVQGQLDLEDIHIFCSCESQSVHSKIRTLMKHHSSIRLESKFSRKVTHMVVDADGRVCRSSADVLQAIVGGMWVLSRDWVLESTEQSLKPLEDYEVSVGPLERSGPRRSRFVKYKLHPGLFNGCHFYLHNFNAKFVISNSLVLNKVILSKLIADAGGVVLKRPPNPELIPEAEKLIPFHAKKDGRLAKCSHYIIFKDFYEPMYNMEHMKALPVGWIIDCIENYELCEEW